MLGRVGWGQPGSGAATTARCGLRGDGKGGPPGHHCLGFCHPHLPSSSPPCFHPRPHHPCPLAYSPVTASSSCPAHPLFLHPSVMSPSCPPGAALGEWKGRMSLAYARLRAEAGGRRAVCTCIVHRFWAAPSCPGRPLCLWPTSMPPRPCLHLRVVGPVPTSLSASVARLCRSQGPRLQFLGDGPGELLPPHSQRELFA